MVFFSKDGTAAPTSITGTGWTALSGTSNGASYYRAYWKIADGTDSLTINHASEQTSHISYRITGHDPTEAPAQATLATDSSANPNPPSLNRAVWTGEEVLWIASYGWDAESSHNAFPSNYSTAQTAVVHPNTGGSGVAASARQLIADTEDPGTATVGASKQWAAQTYGIRPAPLISISGTIYTDVGVTALTTQPTIKLVIGTSTPSVHTTTANSSGVYTFSNIPSGSLSIGTPVTLFVDASTTLRAATMSKLGTTTANTTGLNLYKDHVVARAEGSTRLTLSDIAATYDSTDDADIRFTANSGTNEFSVLSAQTFYIQSGDTFVNAASSTFTGSFNNQGRFEPNVGTSTFTGTGRTITGSLTVSDTNDGSDYGKSVIKGSYTISGNATTSALTIATGGSLTAPSGGYLHIAHDYANSGTFVNNAATTTISGSVTGDAVAGDAIGNTVIKSLSNATGLVPLATSSAFSNNDNWNDVVYGNGRFVAVAGNTDGTPDTYIAYSDDGENWTSVAASDSDDNWGAITYGEGLYVAIANFGGGPMMTSPDGINWTDRSSTAINATVLSDVTYGNGRFVAVGAISGNTRVIYSDDGTTWATTTALGNNDDWNEVTYGNGRFVAVGDDTTGDGAMYSTDGVTWTAGTIPGDANIYVSLDYGNSIFVATAAYDTDGPVMYSRDGITWVKVSGAPDYDWDALTFGNGRFIAGALSGHTMISVDGINWTLSGSTIDSRFRGASYGNGQFVLVGCGGANDSCGTTGSRIVPSTNVTTFVNNASTTNLTISTGSTLVAPALLGVAGNYNNQGVFTAGSSEVIFAGTSLQTATGTMTGTSQFNDLTVLNTSGTGSSTQSVTFNAPLTATGTMAMVASTSVAFKANATTSLGAVNWTGGGEDSPAWLRSTVDGQGWRLDIDGSKLVSFVSVQDSFASSTLGGVIATSSVDTGNNRNWTFPEPSAPYWNATDWTLYDTITIDADRVDATLTDFPVYVDLSDLSPQFWATTPAGALAGTDIRITTNDVSPVELPRELVFASSTLETGELHFRADSISATTDTSFRIYYNGFTDGDYTNDATYGSENVWTNDFVAVYHMNEDPGTSAPQLRDSTVHAQNATAAGSPALNANDLVNAKVGKGWDFEASSGQYASFTAAQTVSGEYTVSAWSRPDDTTSGRGVFSNRNSDETTFDYKFDANNIHGDIGDGNSWLDTTADQLLSYSAGQWHHVAYAVNTSGYNLYVNTNNNTESFLGTPLLMSVGNTPAIGAAGYSNELFEGVIDELRISSTTRTAAWVRAEFYNQSTTTDFYAVNGAPTEPQVWNATDWTLYDTITIDADRVDATLTDFPVYVDLSDLSPQFWATTPTGSTTVGTDIRVTTDANVEVPRELVFASSTLETGELHFKAPTISATTDTVFKIWYNGNTLGDYAATSTYGAQNVWTNNYVAVLHLNEVGNSTANGYIDSAGNGFNGTGVSMTSGSSVAGKLGGAQNLDGLYDYIDLAGSVTLGSTTLSTWVNVASADLESCDGLIFSRGSNVSGINVGNCTDGSNVGYHWNDAAWEWATGPAVVTNEWSYVAVSVGATSATAYSNTTSASNVAAHGASIFDDIRIGEDEEDIGRRFNGNVDEVRIASTSRSTAWLSAEYLNQATTTDFYTVTENVSAGTLTVGDHDGGQVSSAFNAQSKSVETLFAFNLSPVTESGTVTDLVVSLTGAKKISASTFSDVRLYRDDNNDRTYDVGDLQVGGAGSVSLSGGEGTITFTTDFVATTSLDYILVADWSTPSNGSFIVFSLPRSGIDAIGLTSALPMNITGGVTAVQHNRNNKGGAGGNSSGAIGGDAPPGGGVVGGGGSGGGNDVDTNTGGVTIGNEPSFMHPSAQSGSWSTPTNAYDETNGTYATTDAATTHSYYNNSFGIPQSNQITGIAVKLELAGTTAAGTVGVELSWNGGSSWTTAKTTATLTTSDSVYLLGSPSDLWGRSWSVNDFSNENFRVRLSGTPSSNTIRLDAIQVRVYNQTTGGGGGGGGEI